MKPGHHLGRGIVSTKTRGWEAGQHIQGTVSISLGKHLSHCVFKAVCLCVCVYVCLCVTRSG